MTKTRRTLTMDSELSRALSKICVRHGDATWHVEEALRAYKPLKKHLEVVPVKELAAVKKTVVKFQPPTMNEVINYMFELQVIDCGPVAESYIDYWNEQEWKRKGKLMKDWKAAARNWVKNGKKYEADKQRNQPDRNKSAAERVRDAMQLNAAGNQHVGTPMGNPNGDLRHVQQQAPRRTNGSMGQSIEGSYTKTG